MQHTSGQGSFETFLRPLQKSNKSVVTVLNWQCRQSIHRKCLAQNLKYSQPYWGFQMVGHHTAIHIVIPLNWPCFLIRNTVTLFYLHC